jgi:hypothetical protein
VVVKKEAGTPCQVDEVTTSRKERRNNTPTMAVQAIKSEPADDAKNGSPELVVTDCPSTSSALTGEYKLSMIFLHFK